ncbi:hypothetical protein X740_00885 [Mesorhizobium sp. LNHC221B00]|nr:hypothetical protein X740_00885 [Mesorhizobium sp. LNHC221B00]
MVAEVWMDGDDITELREAMMRRDSPAGAMTHGRRADEARSAGAATIRPEFASFA